MRELREHEGEAILTIPLVVGVVIRRVEPTTFVVAVGVEEVEIAIGTAQDIFCNTTL
jgi:hypothetical protein